MSMSYLSLRTKSLFSTKFMFWFLCAISYNFRLNFMFVELISIICIINIQ